MRYALIDIQSGVVLNIVELDDPESWEVPEGCEMILSDKAGIGWVLVNGELKAPDVEAPEPDLVVLAAAARQERDHLLSTIYDRGILMAMRGLRMATTPEEESYAEQKIMELDNYAEALQDIPEQEGFPLTINWPDAPEK